MNGRESGPDLVVTGAGLYGLTIAERAANELGLRVLIIERRAHLGGNVYSDTDPDTGIEVHRYGSHIFHCSDETVWNYVNRFSAFNNYRHHIQTVHRGRMFAIPVNLATLCAFYGRSLSPAEARALVAEAAAEMNGRPPRNLEEKAVSAMGRPLYEALIRGYTRKQWDADPRDLPPEIIARLPVRFDFNTRYFNDPYEGVPLSGYGALLSRMAAHPSIEVRLNTDFFAVRDSLPAHPLLVYTGPLDRYFEFRCGRLGWRAVRFEREVVQTGDYQGNSIVNYADESVPWTRIHEFRHYHPERRYAPDRSVIFREFSCLPSADADPAYPIRNPANLAIFNAYRSLAAAEKATIFGGRLGSYRYLDMHQIIGAALNCFETKIRPFFQGRGIASGIDAYA